MCLQSIHAECNGRILAKLGKRDSIVLAQALNAGTMGRIAAFPDSRLVFGKQAVHECLGQVVLPHTSFERRLFLGELRRQQRGKTTVLDDLLERLHGLGSGLLVRRWERRWVCAGPSRAAKTPRVF